MRGGEKVRPWSFIRSADLLFQVYDDGINAVQGDSAYVANLEYDFGDKAVEEFNGVGSLKSVGEVSFIRLGLPVSMEALATVNRYARFLHTSPVLARSVVTVSVDDIEEVIDLCDRAQDALNGRAKISVGVARDLFDLVDLLQEKTSIPLEHLGIEGSLCVGVSHAASDFDLVLYGETNYKEIRAFFLAEGQAMKGTRIEMFSNSGYGSRTVYNARKHYMPLSEEEMIVHESRKITGFIKTGDMHRKFSIVGILDTEDEMRRAYAYRYLLTSRYKSLGIVTATGMVCGDGWGDFRPAIYELEGVSFLEAPPVESFPPTSKISYVIDNIGNYCSQCKQGELLECRAMLEAEISGSGSPTGLYRLHLNNWDNHLKNKFYVKTRWSV